MNKVRGARRIGVPAETLLTISKLQLRRRPYPRVNPLERGFEVCGRRSALAQMSGAGYRGDVQRHFSAGRGAARMSGSNQPEWPVRTSSQVLVEALGPWVSGPHDMAVGSDQHGGGAATSPTTGSFHTPAWVASTNRTRFAQGEMSNRQVRRGLVHGPSVVHQGEAARVTLRCVHVELSPGGWCTRGGGVRWTRRSPRQSRGVGPTTT